MTADALAPVVTMPSAEMILTILDHSFIEGLLWILNSVIFHSASPITCISWIAYVDRQKMLICIFIKLDYDWCRFLEVHIPIYCIPVLLSMLTFLVLRMEYWWKPRSTSWLMMTWWCHQQPCHNNVGHTGPCLLWGKFSATCAILCQKNIENANISLSFLETNQHVKG